MDYGPIESEEGYFQIIIPVRMKATLVKLSGPEGNELLVWTRRGGMILAGDAKLQRKSSSIDFISIVVPYD